MKSTLHDIHEHAILVSLSISQWSGRKYDKGASAGVNAAHGATDGAARVNKRLLAKNALSKLTTIASAARHTHERMTLPWGLKGIAILAVTGYMEYRDAMAKHRGEFDQAAWDFARNYEVMRDDAKALLGSLFSVDDYPCATKIRARFEFNFDFLPVPHSGDFRVNLHDSQLAEIRQEVEESTRATANAAIREVYERATLVLDTMSSKLGAYVPASGTARPQGIFRDSLVDNVRDMAKMLPLLNVFGDPSLAQLSERMLRVAEVEASDLRESDALRAATAESARALVADIAHRASDYL